MRGTRLRAALPGGTRARVDPGPRRPGVARGRDPGLPGGVVGGGGGPVRDALLRLPRRLCRLGHGVLSLSMAPHRARRGQSRHTIRRAQNRRHPGAAAPEPRRRARAGSSHPAASCRLYPPAGRAGEAPGADPHAGTRTAPELAPEQATPGRDGLDGGEGVEVRLREAEVPDPRAHDLAVLDEDVPSRVIPVMTASFGWYDVRVVEAVTSRPRRNPRTSSPRGVDPAAIAEWSGNGPHGVGAAGRGRWTARRRGPRSWYRDDFPADAALHHDDAARGDARSRTQPAFPLGRAGRRRWSSSSRPIRSAGLEERALLLDGEAGEADEAEVVEEVGDGVLLQDDRVVAGCQVDRAGPSVEAFRPPPADRGGVDRRGGPRRRPPRSPSRRAGPIVTVSSARPRAPRPPGTPVVDADGHHLDTGGERPEGADPRRVGRRDHRTHAGRAQLGEASAVPSAEGALDRHDRVRRRQPGERASPRRWPRSGPRPRPALAGHRVGAPDEATRIRRPRTKRRLDPDARDSATFWWISLFAKRVRASSPPATRTSASVAPRPPPGPQRPLAIRAPRPLSRGAPRSPARSHAAHDMHSSWTFAEPRPSSRGPTRPALHRLALAAVRSPEHHVARRVADRVAAPPEGRRDAVYAALR